MNSSRQRPRSASVFGSPEAPVRTANQNRRTSESNSLASASAARETATAATPTGRGDIVAICDVDDNTLNKKAAGIKGVKKFNDFRKMLDEMGKSIDAVTVSIPDHNHAAASLLYMRAGKHCFCQKPLTHYIYEADLVGKVAAEKKVATQMGNQGTPMTALRDTAAKIRAGAVGTVKEVHVWTNRPIWPQGKGRPATRSRCPRTCTGTNGSARPNAAVSPTAIIRSRGAASGISAPAHWATWLATR